MKKISTLCLSLLIAITSMAVPAKRGWQTRTQADGTTIEVQQIGDEFYHYMINRDGKQVREVNGMYEVVGEAPTPAKAKARRAAVIEKRRAKNEVGTTPNLAPRGVVIMVNFKDKKFQTSHTKAVIDELCNSTSCTVNSYNGVNYPSAAQYFADQSNGTYRPVFDVFGPVTLSKSYSYYGQNIDENGNPTSESNDDTEDQYATDAVIEACILANQQFSNLDFSQYDSDNDGYVDFVYVIYAGMGEANGGAASTIWPHNYEIANVVYPWYYNNKTGQWEINESKGERSSCCYTENDVRIDGKELNNYAMSAELDGSNTLDGIGTLCHEFGHVMGLPDFYDTSYGDVSDQCLSPNDWNIMDCGSYNAGGHCPPNYDPWEKDFFGWHKPINLGNEGQKVTLYANGTSNYQAYQINASGNYVGPTTSGLRYYIENRQAVGWDAPLTGHGMLIWKVTFNKSAWESNTPNNSETSGAPLYTIISATGTEIGSYDTNSGTVDNCPKNTFPGSGKKTSYTGISGKPLKDIKESNKVVTLTYIEEPVEPVDPFEIVWKANGAEFAKTESTGKVVLPTTEPTACDGKVFVGWCKQADYTHATTAPAFVAAGDAVTEGAIFYAVFATKGEGGAEEQTTTYTFTSKSWADATKSWNSGGDGNQLTSGQGVQVTAGASGAGATTKNEFSDVTKVVVKYCTNATKGAGSIKVSVGSTEKSSSVTKTGGTSLRELTYTFDKASGKVAIVVTCSTNSVYVYSVAVTAGGGVSYSNYTTSCSPTTDVESIQSSAASAQKILRNGQLFIIRDGATYTITGAKIENK